MSSDYRSNLFDEYSRHVAALDQDDSSKTAWFRAYASANYRPHLARWIGKDPEVLEIGCNKGYLLVALREMGFDKLHGIDLSPDDVQTARRLNPKATIDQIGARDFLRGRVGSFDVVLMKAVLEHVRKPDTLPLLKDIADSLKPGGVAIVDVPNMDWLFASHERYMDFTHEVGFTRESLRQVLESTFESVEIHPVDSVESPGLGWKKKVARLVLGRLLVWADPQGGSGPIWARSLVAVARTGTR